MRFEEIIEDIRHIFEKGRPKPQGYPISKDDKEDDGKKGPFREVVLQGMKARGAGYRVRKRLQDEFTFIDVNGANQKFPEVSKHPTVLYVDSRYFDQIPESLRELVKGKENVSLLVVDVNEKFKPIPYFSSSIDTNHYIRGFDRDIDPAISRMVAELYLNVDNAVEEDGIILVGGKTIKPYFRTSYLVDYDRSRDILEGILSSVIRKFDVSIVVGRESIGIPPEDVKMYELAKPLAEKVGLESALIERGSQGDYEIKCRPKSEDSQRDYMVKRDLEARRVLLLKDVVGDASTTIEMIKAVKKQKGFVEAVVVLLDRNEGARERLEKEQNVQLYSLTDLVMYEKAAAEKRELMKKAG